MHGQGKRGFGWASVARSRRGCCLYAHKAPHACLQFVAESVSGPPYGVIHARVRGFHGPHLAVQMYASDLWAGIQDALRPIKCKWIYNKEIYTNGNVYIYKARLIAKGYRQVKMSRLQRDLPPIAMLEYIRILLAVASYPIIRYGR